ncbi:ABC-three component system protein [Paenibacillus pedocola]|uniref:ABC-three component system protein n=1 Tax=Paenibacillus pedocola TaxID=3242193 RepID=UPI0028780587|nr:ABC-three component system protein [Paenibacillus typhae]
MSNSQNNNEEKEINLSNTHVPDKVYAYSLQVRHVLYELLSCSGNDVVSIEVLEDVAIEREDGTTDAIQLKSVLSKNNPLTDRSADFWKTLFNWLIAVKDKELQTENTTFKLFVAANRKGNISSLYHDANTLEDAEDIWETSRREFYDAQGNELELGSKYSLYVRHFFSAENKSFATKIIEKFKVQTIETTHTAFIFNSFCQKATIHDDIMENVFDSMLGWIDRKTAEQIEAGKAMAITYKEYKAQLVAITRHFNQNLSLRELAPRPTDQQIQHEYNAFRRYIDQLNLVECDYDEKLEAISDYLRASTNRTLWAKRGDISEVSILNFQEDLIKKWKTKKNIINLTSTNLTAEGQGKLLYLQCKDDSISIDNLAAPSFFTPGCYHSLSDILKIGWHPTYNQLLKTGSENNESAE